MLHNRAIASKNLLQRLEQLLPVQALRQALARSHRLAAIPLLHSDVANGANLASSPMILGRSERVKRSEFRF